MTFRIPSPAEQETYAEIVAQSFGVEPPDALTWVRGLGIENNRVLFEDGELVGGLVRYQAGQWFGGRRLPMVGIAGVSIDPARRGRGFATRLMREALLAFAEEGFPIATLYPATQGVYRRAGFEQAGCRFEIRVPISQCAFRERELVVRPETPEDRAAIEELHRRHGARNPGTVDRSAPLWSRIRTPRNRPAHRGHLIEGPNGLEGYCFLVACKLPTGRQELLVSDFVVETERAARRLLTFFGDHASLADEVVFHGSASDPLLALLPEQRNLVTLNEFWMLRILDLRGALEGRGYPEHVTARLELEVADDCLPANAGRFVLDVAEGKAQVRPGGSGKLRMHVRGLAALYSGFRSPTDLVFLGLAEGEPRELALAASLFAGPPPAMRDFF
jgi:predicted acetyltransferase